MNHGPKPRWLSYESRTAVFSSFCKIVQTPILQLNIVDLCNVMSIFDDECRCLFFVSDFILIIVKVLCWNK